MRRFWISLGVSLFLPLAALALAIVFGGPAPLPPMASINDPFRAVDFSDLPAPACFTARDGTPLAYRTYAPAAATPGRSSVSCFTAGTSTWMSMRSKSGPEILLR